MEVKKLREVKGRGRVNDRTCRRANLVMVMGEGVYGVEYSVL